MIVAMVLIAALSTGDHTAADVAESRRMMRINDYAGWETWEPPALIVPPEASRPRQSWAPSAGVAQWEPLVSRYFEPADVNTALCLIGYESYGGDPNAYNEGSGASGLFQHLPKYWADRSAKAGWAGADIFDPEANTAVAAWLADESIKGHGWHHWTPYNGGLCHGL